MHEAIYLSNKLSIMARHSKIDHFSKTKQMRFLAELQNKQHILMIKKEPTSLLIYQPRIGTLTDP